MRKNLELFPVELLHERKFMHALITARFYSMSQHYLCVTVSWGILKNIQKKVYKWNLCRNVSKQTVCKYMHFLNGKDRWVICAYVEACTPYTLSKLQNIFSLWLYDYVNKLSISETLMSAREWPSLETCHLCVHASMHRNLEGGDSLLRWIALAQCCTLI